MRKIIDGKKYDTETAEQVGEWDNGLCGNDFNYVYEALYRKRTGEFFLYGEGGAMSKYCESRGDWWGSGEEIAPISEEAACKWAERHLDADCYESIFGEVEE